VTWFTVVTLLGVGAAPEMLKLEPVEEVNHADLAIVWITYIARIMKHW